eukprot:TRINITY_DN6077_c0_g1_i1.p1 TRINITY_DN6077_c0_g1~~TRINITY_DN6077_c0_g1_i1.p1  ORF type:complete len:133 (+),score=17.01 TRINITY_DN6077_c0_g1_i1:115-513(+)
MPSLVGSEMCIRDSYFYLLKVYLFYEDFFLKLNRNDSLLNYQFYSSFSLKQIILTISQSEFLLIRNEVSYIIREKKKIEIEIPSWQKFGNFCPLVTVFLMRIKYNFFFLLCPFSFINVRIKMIMPPFSTLFP